MDDAKFKLSNARPVAHCSHHRGDSPRSTWRTPAVRCRYDSTADSATILEHDFEKKLGVPAGEGNGKVTATCPDQSERVVELAQAKLSSNRRCYKAKCSPLEGSTDVTRCSLYTADTLVASSR